MAKSVNIELGNDAEQAIMTQLMDDSVLRGLVEGQIYPSHLSELDQDDIQYPLVTLRQAGSAAQGWTDVFFPQVYQISCWSQRSYNEAMRVRDAVRSALYNERLTAGNSVVLVKIQNLGQNVLDPTASLYYAACQARVTTLDVSTPV